MVLSTLYTFCIFILLTLQDYNCFIHSTNEKTELQQGYMNDNDRRAG